VHALAGEPDVRIFYELYTSEDALAEHESQATTRYFLDRVDDYVTSVDVQRLRLVTATGIADLSADAARPAPS
jgi:quinol monooxygenase YgiN